MAVSAYRKERLRIQGQDKAFLLDTGATANLISTHDNAGHKLKLTNPGRVFTMWNASKQTALGSAPIKVYNPKTKQNSNVLFDIVSGKLTPILGCTAVQAMGLVTMATDRYDSVASVTQYPDVFGKPVGAFDDGVALQVDRDITPTVSPARSLPPSLCEPVRAELRRLQDLKVIEPVTSPTDWVSQMVTVQTRDGSVRLCIDPGPLNQALRRERYHLPTFEEVVPELAEAKVFSKLDLKSGCWHVVLKEESRDLTAFQSPHGRFRWNRLPFGLCVSREIFQRKVHEALDGLPGIHCVADDVIVAGKLEHQLQKPPNHTMRHVCRDARTKVKR